MADTEIIIMSDLARGDASTFERLVAKHERSVYNIIYRFLGRTSDADDLAQEVFMRIWKSAGTYRPTARFTTFLYRVTANVCMSALRERRRDVVSIESVTKGKDTEHRLEVADGRDETPEGGLSKEELVEKVREVVYALPEKQRIAVILRRYEDASYQEIADALEVTTGAVKSLLSRARENIRIRLAPYLSRRER